MSVSRPPSATRPLMAATEWTQSCFRRNVCTWAACDSFGITVSVRGTLVVAFPDGHVECIGCECDNTDSCPKATSARIFLHGLAGAGEDSDRRQAVRDATRNMPSTERVPAFVSWTRIVSARRHTPAFWQRMFQKVRQARHRVVAGDDAQTRGPRWARFTRTDSPPPPESACSVCLSECNTSDLRCNRCHNLFHDECLARARMACADMGIPFKCPLCRAVEN